MTTVSYDVNQGTLTTDRTYSGQRKDMICSRTMYVDQKDGCIRLRVLLDKYALELFVNDGEQAMTSLRIRLLKRMESPFPVREKPCLT